MIVTNTNYNLEISNRAMQCLYSIVLSIINDNVDGIYKEYRTDGHFNGFINSMYAELRAGIFQLSDDISGSLIGNVHSLGCYDDVQLRILVRYPVENPTIILDKEETIVFKHAENNGTDDENDINYLYSTDYVYKDYLLPQEMGNITRNESENLQKRLSDGTITFLKDNINDSWRMKAKRK